MIPYGRQSVDSNDVAAVVEVLQSDWLTQGPTIPKFESCIAKYCGAEHAIAVSSATSALHLACLALGVSRGDRVWTSPISFVASANCALYCGAQVNFVDVDESTACICVDALRMKLNDAKRSGTLPKVVIPVDFGGAPYDWAGVRALADEFGFYVVADASHSLGAMQDGVRAGGGRHADVSVFSFHPVKMITTGEGGMLVTHSEDLAHKLRRLRSHGITRDPAEFEGESHGGWYYEQLDLGYNYRMTDLQGALGLSQMTRLDHFLSARRALATRYDAQLRGLPLRTLEVLPSSQSSHHLYMVLVDDPSIRASVYTALKGAGIGANVHYIPIHLQPYYRKLGFAPGQYPRAEKYYSMAVTLPIYPALTMEQQDQVVGTVASALAAVGR